MRPWLHPPAELPELASWRLRLLDLYRNRARPHLVKPASHWYSTRSLTDQTQRLLAVATDRNVAIAFSADLAPDLVAPWRHPTATVAYVEATLPVEDAGLVPADQVHRLPQGRRQSVGTSNR